MPAISVIVPVYNVEKYLPRCVNSILGQTHTDFELILVDDGSPDNCGIICDEYATLDNRIHVIHQENAGLSAARNAGMDWAVLNSNSEWICFIDSDDWVNKTYLQALYEGAIQEKSLIAVCDFIMTDKEYEDEWLESSSISRISSSRFYNENFYNAQSACCKIFHKSLFASNKYRFQQGILYEDSALIYKILFTQEYVAFTNNAKYYYFRRAESITNTTWNPKKMAYCQVQRNQLQWLIEHNYDMCVKTCVSHYLSTLHYNISLIQEISEYEKYVRTMRKICREMLHKYSKEYKITMEEYPQFYQAAFPHFMEIYWIVKSQIKKLTDFIHE